MNAILKEDFHQLNIIHNNKSRVFKKKSSMNTYEYPEPKDKYVKAFNNLSKEELIILNEFIER